MNEINNIENCVSEINNSEENEYLNSNNIVKVTDNNLLNYALHYVKIG